MDDQTAGIKSEMRVWTLEALVCNMLALMCGAQPDPVQAFKSLQSQMIAGANARTFPGFDPVMSDHLAAELEDAVTRLMDMGKTQIKMGLGPTRSAGIDDL